MNFPDHTKTEKEENPLARRKYTKWTLVCGKKDLARFKGNECLQFRWNTSYAEEGVGCILPFQFG